MLSKPTFSFTHPKVPHFIPAKVHSYRTKQWLVGGIVPNLLNAVCSAQLHIFHNFYFLHIVGHGKTFVSNNTATPNCTLNISLYCSHAATSTAMSTIECISIPSFYFYQPQTVSAFDFIGGTEGQSTYV